MDISRLALVNHLTVKSQMMKQAMLEAAEGSNKKGARGRHLLNRFKNVGGKLYQLHATKGWRKA